MLLFLSLVGFVIAGRPFSLTNATDLQTDIFGESRNEVCEAKARELVDGMWNEASKRSGACQFNGDCFFCSGPLLTDDRLHAICPLDWDQKDIWQCSEVDCHVHHTRVYLLGHKCRVLLFFGAILTFEGMVEEYFPNDECFEETVSGDMIKYEYTGCERRAGFAFELSVWPATGTIDGEVTTTEDLPSWLSKSSKLTIHVNGSNFIWEGEGVDE
jgi:hypothetical protein